MNATELVEILRREGFTLIPLSEGRLAVKPAVRITDDLRRQIRCCKTEVLALLTRPHLNARGELIIPFESDPRFHWWAGGLVGSRSAKHCGNSTPRLKYGRDTSIRRRQ
ncbi:MAG: hypothetical protein EXR78_02805 [Deltaproteobacteria bacterium]|nr:hypothetical protein [Deltaproteobacteria bacterium]